MIRTGLIGFGLGGAAFHAPLIGAVQGFALSAVATSRAAAVQLRYPQAAVTTPEALIADPALDLVVISTPNDTHFPLAQAALKAGKHVVIDKPFATGREDAEALVTLAAKVGRLVVPFHNRRWDGDFRTVRKLIADGVLGEVMLFEAHWDRFRPEPSQPWKESVAAGAGQLADLGPHMIDQALVLFGMPDGITADLARQRDASAVDDYFELTLHYGERRVVLASSRLIAAPRPRFAIHGGGGSFVKYGLDPQEAALRAGRDPNDPEYGLEPPADRGTFTRPDGEQTNIETLRGDYRCFYRHLAEAITAAAPLPVDPLDAVIGLKLIDEARRSAGEARHILLRP